MALQIKSKESLNASGSLLFVEFLNATGTYDVDDNPGGFGTPNPARNTLAFFFVGYHQKVSGDVVADVLASNPLTVSSFTINITRDVTGVLRYSILGIPIFVDGNVYPDGSIVYDNSNVANPIIKEMVDGDWVGITLNDAIGKDTVPQLNSFAFVIDEAIRYSNQLLKAKLLKLRSFVKGDCKDCDRDEYKTLDDRYDYVSGLIIVASNDFCAQAYNEAQQNIEEVLAIQDQFPINE